MVQATVFNEIPYDWLKPGTHIEVRPNYERMGLVPFPARALLVVQRLAAAPSTALQLYRITRPDQGAGLFGAGSIGDAMVRAFKAVNRTSDLYAIAMDDVAGGTQATGTLTFTGAATVATTLAIYVAGVRVPVTISVGMTVTQMATAVAAAINAATGLPVTATSAAGVVTLTARHKGDAGNQIDVRHSYLEDEALPPGVALAIVAMAGGATNPNIATALAAIAAEWFTDIVLPWDDTANLQAFAADLAARYVAMGKKDAHGYVGHRGTFGALTSKGALTNAPQLTAIGANGSPTSPWVWAATLAGLATFHLTNDPARQLRSLALTGIRAPAPAQRFTDTEQDLLLRGGISTFNVLTDGTVTIDRVVTTYKTSALGVPDRAWLDIMVPKTLTRIRYDWASYVSLMYPRNKLADDDTLAAASSDNVVTPKRMLASWAARSKLYERQAWIEKSGETVAQSYFYRSESDRNRLEGKQQIIIIGNLMVLAAALEFQV